MGISQRDLGLDKAAMVDAADVAPTVLDQPLRSAAKDSDQKLQAVARSRENVFEALAEGYLKSAGRELTEAEVSQLAFSSRVVAIELGMRFLTDHLNGDKYFRVRREGHNLDRARTQLKMASCFAEREAEMAKFIRTVMKSV